MKKFLLGFVIGILFVALTAVILVAAAVRFGGSRRPQVVANSALVLQLEGDLPEQSPVDFAHVPLWTIYEKWGWGTQDAAQALGHLKRFGSVSILNGHIHQIVQKVEGNMTFHTARSTAFPQPAPGTAASPGPMKNIPAEKLRSYLGLTRVDYVEHPGMLATTDSTLAENVPATQP